MTPVTGPLFSSLNMMEPPCVNSLVSCVFKHWVSKGLDMVLCLDVFTGTPIPSDTNSSAINHTRQFIKIV